MYFILLFFLIYQCYSLRIFTQYKFLNVKQWESIKKIIVNSDKNSDIRKKLNKIIYIHYNDWSYNKAIEFKKFHYYKCKHIPILELYCYSNLGLMKAIKNYNGKSNFTNYAKYYINGELYKGLTELYPITSISKYERSKKQNISNITIYNKEKKNNMITEYNDMLFEKINVKYNYYSYKNYWQNNNGNSEVFWDRINLLDPFERYLIHSKFDLNFNKKISNDYLAKKFGYSEEYIRMKIKNALHILLFQTPISNK